MGVERVAVIFDDSARPETTGVYCLRALRRLCGATHVPPQEFSKIDASQFDLCVHVDDGHRYPVPESLRPRAYWAIDTHMDFDAELARAREADLVFAAQRDGAERLAGAGIGNAHWLPLACDPEVHRRHEVEKRYDVAFVGHLDYGRRRQLLRLIEREFPNTFIGNRYFDEMARTYSESRVVFNRSVRNDVNMRVFEGLAYGSLLLTNDLSENGQAELFQDGRHLATYANEEELFDKLGFYLRNAAARERVEAAGLREVIARHTYEHRMRRLLEAAEAIVSRTAVVVPAVPGGREQTGKSAWYYEFERPEVLDLIPRSAKRVLEVGCGGGRLGEALKKRQPAEVIGIELDPEAARLATDRLDEVVVADVELLDWDFPNGWFDCIVCADVLEHLREPEELLERARKWLAADGALVASIPNVRHHSVISSLLAGNWTYEPAGLLDSTHVSFFTRRGIGRMLYRAGFRSRKLQINPAGGYDEWVAAGRPAELKVGDLFVSGIPPEEVEEFYVYQYLVVAEPEPRADYGLTSVVIVTRNELDCTRQCLASLRRSTKVPIEVIVVDNGSTDGTVEYLQATPDVALIANGENRGFPAAANQGIRAARGDQIVLLNNDCVVTTGWLSRQLDVLYSDDRIGLVGPCTNRTAGPQRVEADYDVAALDDFAWEWSCGEDSQPIEVPELMAFCVVIRREVVERVGLLDERFGLGMYEDVDYCHRASQAGYRLAIARSAFVHHYGHRSFRADGIDQDKLGETNERLLRSKWSSPASAQHTEPRTCPSGSEESDESNPVNWPPIEIERTQRPLSILYVGDFESPGKSEQYAAEALSLVGHNVEAVHDASLAGAEQLLEMLKEGRYDCLLFYKGCLGAKTAEERLFPTGEEIAKVLEQTDVPAYTWYFDRVYDYDLNRSREAWMRRVAPLCRVAFVTDGALAKTDWARWHVLRQGVSRSTVQRVAVPESERIDVGFIGQIYGNREQELAAISGRNNVNVIQGVFGRALNREIRRHRIIVGPNFPSIPHYWSNRLYVVLGHGGFFLAPEVEGMREEGFEPGLHYSPLGDDPLRDIEEWLRWPAERERIARAGQQLVLGRYTYEHRAAEMIRVIASTLGK